MRNKKGFTLVELLAVIVVLSIIITIAGTNAVRIKKEANIKEAEELKRMLGTVGEGLYSYEKINNPIGSKACEDGKCFMISWNNGITYDQIFYIKVNELINAGYLKNFKNPGGSGNCFGHLKITPKDATFEPVVYCDGVSAGAYTSPSGSCLYYNTSNGDWEETSC